MSIPVTCECGRFYETAATNTGRRAQCPACLRERIVPAPPPEILVIADSY